MPSINWVHLFTDVHGRISRQPFLIGAVVLALVEVIGYQLAEGIQGERFATVVDLAFVYPEFALSVKRANDRNIPTVVLGVLFVGSAVLDFMQLLGWDPGAEHQNPIVLLAFLAWSALALVLAIELFFRRGTTGPNNFGPDPLAPGG
jgi:uncharacterized membrane protein YhaH (DUF805 family)